MEDSKQNEIKINESQEKLIESLEISEAQDQAQVEQETKLQETNDDGFTDVQNEEKVQDDNNNLITKDEDKKEEPKQDDKLIDSLKKLELDDTKDKKNDKWTHKKFDSKRPNQNKYRNFEDKNENPNNQRQYFRQPKDDYWKKPNFKRDLNMDSKPTPSSDLKSRLDYSTRIPTIVDDLFLDTRRGPNGYQKPRVNQNNQSSYNRQYSKKFDKPPGRNDMVITKDFKTATRQVTVNHNNNHKANRTNNVEDKKKIEEVQHEPQNLTPPLTPLSSKIEPPPGLRLPNNFNLNLADKDHAAVIAALMMSNQIFNNSVKSSAPIGIPSRLSTETHLHDHFTSL